MHAVGFPASAQSLGYYMAYSCPRSATTVTRFGRDLQLSDELQEPSRATPTIYPGSPYTLLFTPTPSSISGVLMQTMLCTVQACIVVPSAKAGQVSPHQK
jgi:hypothetical protein